MQAASKTAQQGSIPCTPASCRRGSTEKGAGLVNRLMLVRIQSSALVSRWCNGQHKTLLRSWSWFDSRLRRLEQHGPWVCRRACQLPKLLDEVRFLDGRLTTPCECDGWHGRLRICRTRFDSSAGCLTTCPRSVLDQHATVRRSRIRFDSWRGHF